MYTQQFSDFLSTQTTLSEESIQTLTSGCQTQLFKKGELVTSRSEHHQSYYVQKGLLRYYSVDEKGKEHVLQFAPEGWFISDRLSPCGSERSDFFIEAMEDTEALLLDENFILSLAKNNDSFLEMNNKLLQNHVRQLQNRINQLLSFTAEQRYLEFVKAYPDIMLRVPQTMVASYLGITPESLSRVRKELAMKHNR